METKNFLASKTVQGVLVALLPVVLRACGVEIAEAEAGELANQLIAVAGSLWALYGRFTASKPLTITGEKR